mmetsp:Transcript_13506/g.11333  ORF Transcript_13506/g.11333 Transcript_13506/m.11333 type:complete len:198 (+) Transcript_13506:3-596(+)
MRLRVAAVRNFSVLSRLNGFHPSKRASPLVDSATVAGQQTKLEKDFSTYGIEPSSQRSILRNVTSGTLYESALRHESGTMITSCGALAVSSGAKTGRSPSDKRIVDNPSEEYNDDIWCGIACIINVRIPFFISPAYSVPIMTISLVLKLIDTDVSEVSPLMFRLALHWPALNMTKSGSKPSSSSWGGITSIFSMNKA